MARRDDVHFERQCDPPRRLRSVVHGDPYASRSALFVRSSRATWRRDTCRRQVQLPSAHAIGGRQVALILLPKANDVVENSDGLE